MSFIRELCQKTYLASQSLYSTSIVVRNKFLTNLSIKIRENQEKIIFENNRDIETAKKNNLSLALIDRLTLTPKRIQDMAETIKEIKQLPDPLGEIKEGKILSSGIILFQQSVPLGVVLVIYESRPNVTIDITSLALKSGNSLILRGGKEAIYSNSILVRLIKSTLVESNLDKNIVNFIEKTDKALVDELLKQSQYIDIVVPRGGYELIKRVSEKSSIPVIKHDKGLCHIYLDKNYNLEKASQIIINAKAQRPGVCNAVETLLIHEKYPFIEEILKKLVKANIEIRLDENLHKRFPKYQLANEKDWDIEYLDLILSIKLVNNTTEAIKWVNHYGSKHSDAILSDSFENIKQFKKNVDSACVLINCSTRFHDGGMFGLGAEVGISTQKLHVRGPMGIRHLTCLKYIAEGNGQIRN